MPDAEPDTGAGGQPGDDCSSDAPCDGDLFCNAFGHCVDLSCSGTDSDGDGVCDPDDLRPDADDTVDGDGDCNPDGCDSCPDDDPDDTDSDGVCESDDNCPDDPNPLQIDTDADELGNECDGDDDGDGVTDGSDNCPLVANADQTDATLLFVQSVEWAGGFL